MIRKVTTPALLFFALVFCLFGESHALKSYSSPNIKLPADSVITEDVYLTGDKIRMDATVDGDLVAFCRSLVYEGKLKGSMNVFSYQTVVSGELEKSLRCFCYEVDVNSPVGGDLIGFGYRVSLGPEGTVKNDALMFCNRAIVDGNIEGDLTVGCERATIGGTIGGDVDIEAERIYILPTASIKGNLTYKSPEPAKIESGATILGTTDWEQVKEAKERKGKGLFAILPGLPTNMIFFQIAMGGLSFLIGLVYSGIFSAVGIGILIPILLIIAVMIAALVVVTFSRQFTEIVRNKVYCQSLKSLSLGLLVLIIAPMVILLLMMTFLGLPLAMLALLSFVLSALFGWIFSAYLFGERILRFISAGKIPSRAVSTLLGVLLLLLLGLIPFWVGFLITLIASIWGLGAVLLAGYGLLRPAEKAAEAAVTPA
jgi:hypothetical protein